IEYRQSAPDKTQITGAVTISGGSLRATTLPEDITDISAQIKITPAEINLEKLHVAFESSDFTLSGVISDPFPYLLYLDSTDEDAPSPFLSFTGHSSRLDIDRLFPEAAPGSAVNRGALPATEAPPLPLPLVKGSGRVTFDTLVYSEAELTNVTADVRIHRDIIYCQDVRGDVYGGSFTGETTIDLREFENPHYTGRFDAANLLAGPAVSHFSPWDGGGSLLGRIKLSGDYDSYGWKPEDFLGSLSMNLLSSGDSLELKGFSFLAPLGVSFAEMTGMTTFKKQLATLDLRSFSSRLQFVDGKIMLNRLTGSSPKLGGWDLSGAVGLDGALDLKCAYAPSDEILPTLFRSKGLDPKYSDLLINPKTGRVELPLLIGGAFAKPTISIDEKKIGDIVGAALKKSAGDFLKDLFKQ
ncbi:MAG: hypothetical protein ACE5GA_04275, partial [Candidatus Zixiibacteriota bacterium]